MSPLLPSSLRSAALTNFAHPFFAVKGESLFESTFWKPGTSSEVRGYDYGVSSVRTLPLALSAELHVLTSSSCGQWSPEITNDSELGDRAHSNPTRSEVQTIKTTTTAPNNGRSTHSWNPTVHTQYPLCLCRAVKG